MFLREKHKDGLKFFFKPRRWRLEKQRMWITKNEDVKAMSKCDIFCIWKSSQPGTSCCGNKGAEPGICCWLCGAFLGTAMASVCRGPAGPPKWGLYEVSSAINVSLPLWPPCFYIFLLDFSTPSPSSTNPWNSLQAAGHVNEPPKLGQDTAYQFDLRAQQVIGDLSRNKKDVNEDRVALGSRLRRGCSGEKDGLKHWCWILGSEMVSAGLLEHWEWEGGRRANTTGERHCVCSPWTGTRCIVSQDRCRQNDRREQRKLLPSFLANLSGYPFRFHASKYNEYEKSCHKPQTVFIQIRQNRFLKASVNISERCEALGKETLKHLPDRLPHSVTTGVFPGARCTLTPAVCFVVKYLYLSNYLVLVGFRKAVISAEWVVKIVT